MEPKIKITACLVDGPIVVSGPAVIRSVREVVDIPEGASCALCRCSRSANLPYCDGSHKNHYRSERPEAKDE